MSNPRQRRPGIWPATPVAHAFVVGERVRIVHAPTSYGYNGRAGTIMGIDGAQINVIVDEHPADMCCTTFYPEELEYEVIKNVEQ
jgi:hypothetical protein